ncbi:hypothetical protein AKJ16_DCAP22736 [Drosera capensis]
MKLSGGVVPFIEKSRIRIPLLGTTQQGKMSFIMEFAENLILRTMEDPKERDRKFREHLYTLQDKCKKTKEMWSLPLRPYGFWTFERHNSQLAWDAQISNVTGRRDPYDELLDPTYKKRDMKMRRRREGLPSTWKAGSNNFLLLSLDPTLWDIVSGKNC